MSENAIFLSIHTRTPTITCTQTQTGVSQTPQLEDECSPLHLPSPHPSPNHLSGHPVSSFSFFSLSNFILIFFSFHPHLLFFSQLFSFLFSPFFLPFFSFIDLFLIFFFSSSPFSSCSLFLNYFKIKKIFFFHFFSFSSSSPSFSLFLTLFFLFYRFPFPFYFNSSSVFSVPFLSLHPSSSLHDLLLFLIFLVLHSFSPSFHPFPPLIHSFESEEVE